ncbi:MAG: branched-chain amino acid ABC transporter permease [Verrucomicrobiota bacterium]
MKTRAWGSTILLGILLVAITYPFIWLKLSYEPLSGVLRAIPDFKRGFAFLSGLAPLVGSGLGIYFLFRFLKQNSFFQKKTTAVYHSYKHIRRNSFFPLILFLVFASLAFFSGPKTLNVLIMVGIYMILSLGLNVTIGMTGLLVLGYAGFFALGGYTFAILQQKIPGVTWWMAMPMACLIGAAVGGLVGLPCLRLKGDYLAIVTLGFAESFREMVRNMSGFTGGDSGLVIQAASKVQPLFGLGVKSMVYLWVLAAVFLTVIILHRLYYSPLGRAWTAIRENEIAAEAMGVPVVKMKLLAFSLSAVFAAIAGVFYTAHIGFLNPESSAFEISVLVLAMVILGGLGSIPGALLGSFLLYYIPTILRDYFPTIADYRLLLFGTIMVIMMLVRPQGLLGSKDRV